MLSVKAIVGRARKALTEIGYGEAIVKAEAGRPIWADNHKRGSVG
jgi:hypothetical protein